MLMRGDAVQTGGRACEGVVVMVVVWAVAATRRRSGDAYLLVRCRRLLARAQGGLAKECLEVVRQVQNAERALALLIGRRGSGPCNYFSLQAPTGPATAPRRSFRRFLKY